MTTIAVRGGVMVSDSQCTSNFISRVKKIHRLPDGSLAGGAGHAAQCAAGIEWLKSGKVGDAPDSSDCHFLILKPNGKIVLIESGWAELKFTDKFMAIGSGSTAAMAAMMAGCDALQAVKIAAKLDDGTSGPFHTLKLAAL